MTLYFFDGASNWKNQSEIGMLRYFYQHPQEFDKEGMLSIPEKTLRTIIACIPACSNKAYALLNGDQEVGRRGFSGDFWAFVQNAYLKNLHNSSSSVPVSSLSS